ncbi:MLO-like protein 4 [Prunus yedoensis var. nudiflora]|uniref:MLO-like protein n=1 Tax=Prunus yedoensis var. nudiflora TaxID=2094558 RepID=A0A314YXG2_PRUYE|nr:MLO-like protein 4 [Prunus yedoensis var. nudiflora]
MEEREGRSLAETPTWTVASVITFMVVFGFFFNGSLERFGKWLDKTKRKSLFAALDKIKEELMLFGVMSLLMGHWIFLVAKICVKSSLLSSKFFPCALESDLHPIEHVLVSSLNYLNKSVSKMQVKAGSHDYCPEGHESFASKESLEQLHRLMFVLGVTHVSYSFVAIVLAMIKIYSWRVWENEAKALAIHALQASYKICWSYVCCTFLALLSLRVALSAVMVLFTVNFARPKLQLCFTRQFWSSINRSDYMALRFGFITLILLIGTKLHRVVVKLAVEITEESPHMENQQFKLKDELFWFKKPWLLLRLIQLISFQNALEMATFIWSLWEIKEPSCFMDNSTFLVIRLTFGVVTQFWCSFITFPLYVIITQMGERFKKSVVSENVRNSLSVWKRRVKAKQSTSSSTAALLRTSTSSDSIVDEMHKIDSFLSNTSERSSFKKRNTSFRHLQGNVMQGEDEKLEFPLCVGPVHDSYSNDKVDYHSDDHDSSDVKDELCLLPS